MAAGDIVRGEYYSPAQRKVETLTITGNAGTAVTFTTRHITHISDVQIQMGESHGAATGNNATYFVSWSGTTVTITGHAGLTADKLIRVRVEGW